ncbi:DUF507 family protein [Pseudobdellovibrio sp. HCB154]|uniref:DUF507 family protein n=1 Tax=Pseudobdellovibrio sp. HCB154 TaxID=3386277 RepID=UPI003916CEAF
MMKLTASQIQRLSEKILAQWKSQNLITLKVEEKQVLQAMKDAINEELQAELDLEKEVHGLMDQMEQQGQEFQRGKMFQLLKTKLAKEKKVIL